jgi:hypothetical protein
MSARWCDETNRITVKRTALGDTMKTILLAAVALVLMQAPAKAYLFCSEPSAPYCATMYGSFNDGYDFEDCKRDVVSYGEDVEDYIQCLNDASQTAIDEYNDAIDSFNRRARGY